MSNPNVHIIQLPDNNEWVVKRMLTRGDRKYIDARIREEQSELMASMQKAGLDLAALRSSVTADLTEEEAKSLAALRNAGVSLEDAMQLLGKEQGWTSAQEDATLFRATISSSLFDQVTEEAIDNTDDDIASFVIEKLKGFYKIRTKEQLENLEPSLETP